MEQYFECNWNNTSSLLALFFELRAIVTPMKIVTWIFSTQLPRVSSVGLPVMSYVGCYLRRPRADHKLSCWPLSVDIHYHRPQRCQKHINTANDQVLRPCLAALWVNIVCSRRIITIPKQAMSWGGKDCYFTMTCHQWTYTMTLLTYSHFNNHVTWSWFHLHDFYGTGVTHTYTHTHTHTRTHTYI